MYLTEDDKQRLADLAAAEGTTEAELIRRGVRCCRLSPDQVADCVDLDRSYHDLGLGLTYAHLVILAREHNTLDILSLDERHLRAVRPLRSGPAFRLLPSDR